MCASEGMQIQKENYLQDESVCPIALPLQRQLFIYGLVTGRRGEVGKGTGEGGIMKKEKEERKRFVSANERAKFFMCFWGNKIEFTVLTLDCKSRRLLWAAVGSVFALGPGMWVGGGQSQADHVLALGCRYETGPRYGV